MTVKPGTKRSRLDPEPIPRRDFLGLLSLGSAGAALFVAIIGMARLPKAAVLPSPAKKFTVAFPENLPAGEPFIPTGRTVALFRDEEGVYAVSTICTHLGCVIKPKTDGFECPCHGSCFARDGSVTKGPAPRALPWLKVSEKNGSWIVDEGTTVPAGSKVKA